MVLMRTNKKVLKLLSIKNNYIFLSVTSKIGCGRHFEREKEIEVGACVETGKNVS